MTYTSVPIDYYKPDTNIPTSYIMYTVSTYYVYIIVTVGSRTIRHWRRRCKKSISVLITN